MSLLPFRGKEIFRGLFNVIQWKMFDVTFIFVKCIKSRKDIMKFYVAEPKNFYDNDNFYVTFPSYSSGCPTICPWTLIVSAKIIEWTP